MRAIRTGISGALITIGWSLVVAPISGSRVDAGQFRKPAGIIPSERAAELKNLYPPASRITHGLTRLARKAPALLVSIVS